MAEMIFKITAISYFSIICSASAPTLIFDKKLILSSQDLSFSNKYSSHNKYIPIAKAIQKKDTANVAPIQYAPLYTAEVQNRNEKQDYHKTNFDVELRKKQLEPNLDSFPQSALPYVPGHNIEILQSVNRGPGLEHRSISQTTVATTTVKDEHQHEKIKVKYHRVFSVFKKPENIMDTNVRALNEISIPATNVPMDQYTRILTQMTDEVHNEKYNPEPANVLDQQLLRNHKTLQDIHELTKQIEAQRVVGYPKMNTLLLNLARVYSPRVQTLSQVNYMDHRKENGGSNSQSVQTRSPSTPYSDAKRNPLPHEISQPLEY